MSKINATLRRLHRPSPDGATEILLQEVCHVLRRLRWFWWQSFLNLLKFCVGIRNIVLYNPPDHIIIDIGVIMNDFMPNSGNVLPIDFRVLGREFLRDVVCRLSDNGQIEQNAFGLLLCTDSSRDIPLLTSRTRFMATIMCRTRESSRYSVGSVIPATPPCKPDAQTQVIAAIR